MNYEYTNSLFSAALELAYLIEKKEEVNISIAEVIMHNIKELLKANGGSFADAFEFEDKYGNNPGVDLIIDAYETIEQYINCDIKSRIF